MWDVPGDDDDGDVVLFAVLVKVLEARVQDDVYMHMPRPSARLAAWAEAGRDRPTLLELLLTRLERVSVRGHALEHLPERIPDTEQ